MKNKHLGSSFDSFLEEEGIFEEVTLHAIKKVIAFALIEAMKKENITKTELAKKLCTSRTALERLLDPNNYSVTLHTLHKAAQVAGKKLDITLSESTPKMVRPSNSKNPKRKEQKMPVYQPEARR